MPEKFRCDRLSQRINRDHPDNEYHEADISNASGREGRSSLFFDSKLLGLVISGGYGRVMPAKGGLNAECFN